MNTLFTRRKACPSGRYRPNRELSAGGIPTVYHAHTLQLRSAGRAQGDASGVAVVGGGAQFRAEIRIVANLQHPPILSLLGAGEVYGSATMSAPGDWPRPGSAAGVVHLGVDGYSNGLIVGTILS